MIQLGFDYRDDKVVWQYRGKTYTVPCYVDFVLMEGGLGAYNRLLRYFGLTKYRARGYEPEALLNVELDALAIANYITGGHDFRLTDLGRRVLDLEIQCKRIHPRMTPRERLRWIAAHKLVRDEVTGERGVAYILENVSAAMRAEQAKLTSVAIHAAPQEAA